MGADVVVHLVGGRLPAHRDLPLLPDPGESGAAVCGNPAHHLGGGEVLGVASDLPHPTVGLSPVLQRLLYLTLEDRPEPFVQVVPGADVEVDRLDERPPDVVLPLVVGPISD